MRDVFIYLFNNNNNLPPLGSRVRVSVPPCGFRGGRNGVWVGFYRGFFRFPLPQISFHHFSTLISSISFHFITLVMVRQAWSAGTLAIHGPTISGLHCISSLDPTLCWTQVEDYDLLSCRALSTINSGEYISRFNVAGIKPVLLLHKQLLLCPWLDTSLD